MRNNKINGFIIILLSAINLLSGKTIDNLYFDFKYGFPLLTWSSYEVIDLYKGPLVPPEINFTAGHIFSKPNISLISFQQLSFEKAGPIDNRDNVVKYLNYSTFLGLGKIIKIYSSLLNLYGLIGYSWNNLLFECANSAKIIAAYPVFCIGSDFYYKFIPFADFVLTYRFGITSANTFITQKGYYVCKYSIPVFQNQIEIGLSFGKISKMH